jgi:hypothetical protein
MARRVIFVFIFIFSLLFVLSATQAISSKPYGHFLNSSAQIGLAVSLIVFFIIPADKPRQRKS